MFSLLLYKTKKQVSEISNTLKSKQVLYFKQVLVTSKKILNRKNKKQEKNSFQNLPKKEIQILSICCLHAQSELGP